MSNALLGLLHPADTQNCKSMDYESTAVKFRQATSEQRLKEKGDLDASLLDNSFETINAFTRSHTASHASAGDIRNNNLMLIIG